MGRTATQLGREFLLNGREMNQLLYKHGFLDGKPGEWGLSELGEKFAKWVDKDNGYGGFAARSWSFLSWSDDVVDALKDSIAAKPDGVQPAVSKVAEAAADRASKAVAASKVALDSGRTSSGGGLSVGRNEWVAAAALVALSLGASTPAARNAWQEKVKPAAARARARFRGTQGADGVDDTEDGSE